MELSSFTKGKINLLVRVRFKDVEDIKRNRMVQIHIISKGFQRCFGKNHWNWLKKKKKKQTATIYFNVKLKI